MTANICSGCGRDLPEFNSTSVSVGEDDVEEFDLLAISFHVRCPCGTGSELRMRTDGDVS